MTNVKEIIINLKQVREEKKLSYGDILKLMEQNGDYLAKSTLSRVFAEGSEECSFKYEETIRPIAKALLDIETIEENDTMDIQAMKALLRYKIQRIEELEEQVKDLKAALSNEKLKYHEKLDSEREHYNERIDFMNHQIELKDKRMDMLLEAVFHKDKLMNQLSERLYECQCCSKRNV